MACYRLKDNLGPLAHSQEEVTSVAPQSRRSDDSSRQQLDELSAESGGSGDRSSKKGLWNEDIKAL